MSENITDIKQVIVVRKDLKMRRGKEIAQGAHASMMFLIKQLHDLGSDLHAQAVPLVQRLWMFDRPFTKITLQVNSEQELIDIYTTAKDAGLTAHLVQDNGLTEFGGQSTYTCCAIGPDYSSAIDKVTKNLKLY